MKKENKNKTTLFLLFLIAIQGFFHHTMENSKDQNINQSSMENKTNGDDEVVEGNKKRLKTDKDLIVGQTIGQAIIGSINIPNGLPENLNEQIGSNINSNGNPKKRTHSQMEDQTNANKRTHSQMEETNPTPSVDSIVESQAKRLNTNEAPAANQTIMSPAVNQTMVAVVNGPVAQENILNVDITPIKTITSDMLNRDENVFNFNRLRAAEKLMGDFFQKFSNNEEFAKSMCLKLIPPMEFPNFFNIDRSINYSSIGYSSVPMNLLLNFIAEGQDFDIISKLYPEEDFFQLNPVGDKFEMIDVRLRVATFPLEDALFNLFFRLNSMERWGTQVQTSLSLIVNHLSSKKNSLALQMPRHLLHYTMYPMANSGNITLPNNQYGLLKSLIDNIDFFQQFFTNRANLNLNFRINVVLQSLFRSTETLLRGLYPNIFVNNPTNQQRNFTQLKEAFAHFQIIMSKSLMEIFVNIITAYRCDFNKMLNSRENTNIFSIFDILILMGSNFHQIKYIAQLVKNNTTIDFGFKTKNIKNLVDYMDSLFNITMGKIAFTEKNVKNLGVQLLQTNTLLVTSCKYLLSGLFQEYTKTNVENSDIIIQIDNNNRLYPGIYNQNTMDEEMFALAQSITMNSPLINSGIKKIRSTDSLGEVFHLTQNLNKAKKQSSITTGPNQTNMTNTQKNSFKGACSFWLEILSYAYPVDTTQLFLFSELAKDMSNNNRRS